MLMSLRARLPGVALVAVLAACAPVVLTAAPAAVAAPLPGIDAREPAEAMPAAGGIVESSSLDPAIRLPGAGHAYRMTYATTGARGEAVLSAATVQVPEGTPPPGGWPVIAWAHGTTGIGDACAPSTDPAADRDYPAYWLRQGFAIVATDYAGLGTPGPHPYLHAGSAASSVADSVRAARDLNLRLSRDWVAIGHSQGGQAVIELARRPGASGEGLRGVVALAPAAPLPLLLGTGTPEPRSLPGHETAYLLFTLAGLADAYPQIPVSDALTATGRELLASARTLCSGDLAERAEGVALDEILARPLREVPGLVDAATAYLGMPSTGHQTRILVAQGLDDSIPPSGPIGLADRIHASGGPITLRTYPGVDHGGVLDASSRDARSFVEAVLGPAPEQALRGSGLGG
ncbi:alpha/beta hydrolase [Hoyosella sp. G463]|uniref:Alpha/beta hydrolase n=1 Tax=Lolliginicoccus lacisalsi TaxID=2742202 RepID=A0A927JCP9_9ACTN|nr:alpha/beta hydrolase [Lolliginicoccus lacisalsi]MBD8506804.1 alpha/beta hydrolase [Lolliginicoccus lacisalsi]